MKRNELRIGNWIRVMRSLPTRVTGYYLFMMETYKPLDPNEADYEDMTEFIPLEEGHLKTSFWPKREDGYYVSHCCDYAIKQREDYWLFYHHSEVDGEIDWIRTVHIKYVHQLQNLYFALTGEELEIKLNDY